MKFSVYLEDDNYAPTAWGFWTREIKLEHNPLGYLVLVLNHERGSIGDFLLTVYSDKLLPG
jgi:hypothetical protein